jgi:opacity protein-like surface antigen
LLKQIFAIGVIGLMFMPAPAFASNIDGETAAGYGLGGALIMAVACTAVRAFTMDEDVEEEGYDRRGWYGALGGTYARQNFGNAFDKEYREKSKDDNTVSPDVAAFSGLSRWEPGFNIRAGYRCHPRMSTEIEFERLLGNFQGAAPRRPVRPMDLGKIEITLATVNTKVHLLTGRIQPFGLIGGGFMRAEAKVRDPVATRNIYRNVDTVFTLRLGGGADLYATDHIVLSVGADYIRPYGELKGAKMWMYNAGLQYRF